MDAFVWKAAAVLAACGIFLGCLMLFQSKKSKHKIHYYAAAGGMSGPIILAAIAILMEQFGLFFLSIGALLIICLILIVTSRSVFLADTAEDLQNFDASAPLCFGDFFSSWRSIVKLERKYGENKTLVIHLLLMMGFAGLGLVIVYWVMIDTVSWPGRSFPFMPGFGGFIGASCAFIINYRSIKKRLNQHQNTSTTLGGEQKFCTACGAPNAKEAKYCVKCGKKFLEQASA